MHQRLDFDRPTPVVPKPRKMSTGGNRSWSEEEEAYLIQTRMQKMPYKHIAAHLKKTELACRLHYHQLSHGSHRRRRTSTSTTSSTSSTGSNRSMTQYPLPGFDHNGFQTQPHQSNGYHSLAGNYPGMHQSPGRAQHKILLPKPPALSPETSPDRYAGLRIDTNNQGMPQGMPPNPVDADRLHNIYNSHRSNFWSAIAAEYGTDASATQLEDTWKYNPNTVRRPPTPGDSPNSRAVHNILKPSPFPAYYEQPREYQQTPVLTGMSPQDRLPYPMGTAHTQHSYDTIPSLPRLDRQHSWSNHTGAPPTAISTLLNEDKCSRHDGYCAANGRCFGNH
ncbi:hypothetical protein BT63DRAFT_57571 [Microthyrium microscopicum]|uniref:Myb-like domain-containing protein n=1 Tax=Microthyrium microscopicum TaxID=703497 RepID=A0A6A6U281_9PEZI|nr:hypothetical protein BT63DRAFT_57571 [Microthyrium microscopicum]